MSQSITPYGASGLLLASNQTTLPFPPVAANTAVVQNPALLSTATQWNTPDAVLPNFDLTIWGNATNNLTSAQLWGAQPHPFTLTGQAITSIAGNVITLAAHGYLTGDGPVQITTTGTFPGGALALTNYWIITLSANTFSLALSAGNALAGTVVVLSTAGSGTITLTGTAAAARITWHEVFDVDARLIGRAGDGAIALTNQKGWIQRFNHTPNVIAYGFSATASGAGCSVSLVPIKDR